MVWEHRSKTHKVLDSGVQFCLTAMMQCRELASLALSISGTTSSSLFTQEGSVFSTATAPGLNCQMSEDKTSPDPEKKR